MGTSTVTGAKSITHEHLLSVVNTEAGRFNPGSVVRVLDAGCGNGHLMAYLQQNLSALQPELNFEVYGFDVADHGVQSGGFHAATVAFLSEAVPGIDWAQRVVLLSVEDPWPYSEGFFDVVLSNQVGEHIQDHDHFFSEVVRVLRSSGFSAHLFPLGHYVLEGHLFLPWVHRIKNYDLMLHYIKVLSRLGLGIYPAFKRSGAQTLEEFAESHADYMHYLTNYMLTDDLLTLAKQHKIRASFRYTHEFYSRKISSLLGLPKRYRYKADRSAIFDAVTFNLLKYVSSVTVFMEKKFVYRA